jgi:hypothetical protein
MAMRFTSRDLLLATALMATGLAIGEVCWKLFPRSIQSGSQADFEHWLVVGLCAFLVPCWSALLLRPTPMLAGLYACLGFLFALVFVVVYWLM